MKKFTGLFSIFAFIFFFFASLADAQLNFYFVNVGQGDATYIELPNGKNALIDGGPTNRLINDFLNSKNVTHIDHVVLTHPHSDHYIGLKKVFKTRTVSNFYDSRVENIAAKGDNTLREQANAQRACKTHFPKIGEKLNWDPSVDVKVLNTCETPFETRNNSKLNNCSIVLKITYNGTTVMMMGDAEMPAEAEILKRFPNELKSYALKAGHHGSDTASSEAFLAKVQPKVAILSFGANNKYGHPDYDALMRLQKYGAQLFATQAETQTLFLPAPGKRSNAEQPQIKAYNPNEQLMFDFGIEQPVEVSIPMLTDEQKTKTKKKKNKIIKDIKKFGSDQENISEQLQLF